MKRPGLVMSVILALGVGSPASAALDYSRVIVFGDSLVDSGNAQLGSLAMGLPDPAPAAAGYFQGRFSNGYNFADYLSLGYVGVPASPFLANPFTNSNFGVGGAKAAYEVGSIIPSFIEQLALFQATGQSIAGDALVIVTFGGNDVRGVLGDPDPIDFAPTVTAMQNGLAALAAAGAKNILVTGIPDIGLLPSTLPADASLATARAQALNAQFQAKAQLVAALSGADIDFFDLFALDEAAHADPSLNTTDTCQSGGAAAVIGGCVGYLYFDTIHPTTAIHQFIARQMAMQLAIPEPATWLAMVAGFALVGGMMRRRAATVTYMLG